VQTRKAMLTRQWDRVLIRLKGGEMSNARGLESVVDEGCGTKINAFQGRECFLGLSVGVDSQMQEARALAAFGQALHLSARKAAPP
jgi:hypothetical protein